MCEKSLTAFLKNGHIAGAALDVHEHEPNVNPELALMEHVILTPHIASSCYEARVSMMREALDGVSAYFRGERPENLLT